MRYSEGLDTTGVSDLASARGYEGRRTNQGSCIIYITEKPVRQHHLTMRRARLLGYWLRLACSGWPAGFVSTCFYLSKLQPHWFFTDTVTLYIICRKAALALGYFVTRPLYVICRKLASVFRNYDICDCHISAMLEVLITWSSLFKALLTMTQTKSTIMGYHTDCFSRWRLFAQNYDIQHSAIFFYMLRACIFYSSLRVLYSSRIYLIRQVRQRSKGFPA